VIENDLDLKSRGAWVTLSRNETHHFHFAIPARGESVRFLAYLEEYHVCHVLESDAAHADAMMMMMMMMMHFPKASAQEKPLPVEVTALLDVASHQSRCRLESEV
jgi:hypothetical protein